MEIDKPDNTAERRRFSVGGNEAGDSQYSGFRQRSRSY